MELLRLLTHGKPGGTAASTTTISTTVLRPDSDDGGDGSEDEGPFFDLEFALPLQGDEDLPVPREKQRSSSDAEPGDDDEDAEEFDLTVGSLRRDPVLSFSPSEGLFFKGRLVPLEPSSLKDFAGSELPKSSKSSKPQVAAFLLKSAAKFRVFKLGFHRKSKSTSSEPNPGASPATTTTASPKQQHQNKFFVKFKVEEVPLASLFARDTSWRSSSSSSRSARLYADDGLPASTDERKLPRDALHRYLRKIKPLYIRISKRYGEKLRFSGPLTSSGAGKVRPAGEGGEAGGGDQLREPASAASSFNGSLKSQDGNIPAGLRVVCRRLRKSRSASAAVASVRSPPLAAGRRNDSLLEQQDGIQSAIAHCKRSFNRGSESPLMRSRSDPGDGRSVELSSSNV